ncbi:hypothetical protein FNF28_07204 [Cafeteria roenbergensis]|uniref:DNA-directed RNA polymerase subunit n=1 Tax=Cafeteria roenbergensis TaxID=33653 RepID=A0A5A8CCN4_CAFRO|nr:hypothetical protein FNF28_07204 [Cafeteria roenbergensis]
MASGAAEDDRWLTTAPTGLTMSMYHPDEVRRLAAVEITSPITFDALNNAVKGGLYDSRMGPMGHGQQCPTCGLGFDSCPGHLGVMELPAPVYHPLMFNFLFSLLRSKCFCCHHFRASAASARLLRCQLMLLDCGDAARASTIKAELAAAARQTSADEATEDLLARQNALMDAIEAEASARLSDAARDSVDAAGLARQSQRGCAHAPVAPAAFAAQPLPGSQSPHVRGVRAALVDAFIKSQPDTCANCGAPKVGLRKDGTARLFLRPLAAKQALVMQRLNLNFESAVGDTGAPGGTPAPAPGDDGGVSLFPELYSGMPDSGAVGDRLLAPAEAQAQLAALWSRERAVCSSVWSPIISPRIARHPAGWRACFLSALPVAPNRFRPPTELGELKFEHPQTSALSKVLGFAQRYRLLQAGRDPTAEAKAAVARQRDAEKTARRLQRKRARATVGKDSASSSSSSSSSAAAAGAASAAAESKDDAEEADAAAEGAGSDVDASDSDSDSAPDADELAAAAASSAASAAGRGPIDMGRLLHVWQQMTDAIHGYMDSNRARERDAPAGLRQLLEKKEGLFRKHMMGKRVNFAARSVISPDPFIRTDQIGVPVRFARRLSFPQAVAAFNAAHLATLVENGPDVYPGALAVELPNGLVQDLSVMTPEQRRAIARTLTAPAGGDADVAAAAAASSLAGGAPRAVRAPTRPKRVYRHLLDGDLVLMNRQPTLHKPGIMAHRVRVLRSAAQQTLRMHYANCKTYNADFDGDEMNMHLPQDHLSRAEAAEIASTPNQYVVPTTGQPIRGLIQDHIAVGTLLTRRDCLLSRDHYSQLVWDAVAALPGVGEAGTTAAAPPGADVAEAGLRAAAAATAALHGEDEAARIHGYRPGAATRDVATLEPAILLPRKRGGLRLWTGKQVISTLLLALLGPGASFAVSAKAKLGARSWCARGFAPLPGMPGDERVVVRCSELCTGVLDKNSLGNASYGAIHTVYELYGPQAAASLLSAFGRLLTAMLQRASISCGLADLVLTPEADRARVARIRRTYHEGARASAAFAGAGDLLGEEGEAAALAAAAAQGPSWLTPPSLSLGATRAARVALRDRLRGGEARDPSAASRLGAELDGAAKGVVAIGHGDAIRICLPDGLERPFPTNFFSLMVDSGAKGSLVNHAMIACGLGQQELEGRRVPTMVSGRTLPSFPPYDPSPRAGGYVADRFLTGLRPQEYYFHCMSGREGLVDTAVKTSRSGYLQRCLVKHLEELTVGYDHTVRDAEGCIVQFLYGEDGLDVTRSAFLGGSDTQLGLLAANGTALRRQLNAAIGGEPGREAGADSLGTLRAHGVSAAATRARDASTALALEAARRRRAATAKAGGSAPADAAVLEPAEAAAYATLAAASLTPGAVVEVLRPAPSDEDPAGADWRGPAAAGSVWVRARLVKVRLGKVDPFAPPASTAPRAAAVASAVAAASGLVDLHFPPAAPAALSPADLKALRKHGGFALAKRVAIVDAWRGPIVRPVVPEPPLSLAAPSVNYGAVSEKFYDKVTDYAARNPHNRLRAGEAAAGQASLSPSAFDLLMRLKAARALADPGEPVGVLAAQSVGEPSTQMTLNTFHLAGHGGVNVTLGIPRLREIVMTASTNIKTPAMTLPILGAASLPGGGGGAQAERIARRLAARLDQVSLGALLDVGRKDGGIAVRECIRPEMSPNWTPGSGAAVPPGASWVREYAVRLVLAPPAAIKKEFRLDFDAVASAAGRQFVPKLLQEVARDLKRSGDGTGLVEVRRLGAAGAGAKRGKGKGPSDDDDDGAPGSSAAAGARAGHEEVDDEDDAEDAEDAEGGADEGTLRLGRRREVDGYEDDEEAEAEVNAQAGKDGDDDDDEEDGDDDDEQAAAAKAGEEESKSAGSASDSSDSDSDSDDAPAAKSSSSSSSSSSVAASAQPAPGGGRGTLPLAFSVSDAIAGNPRFLGLRGDPVRGVLEVRLAFPASARKVLMLGAAESAARASVVRETPGVRRAVAIKARLSEGAPEEWTVQTEGVNLGAAFAFSRGFSPVSDAAVWAAESGEAEADAKVGCFDAPKVRTNDIGAILRTYGVEACRAAIVREVKAVFGVYGISVDNRHLGLIADYMTHEGGYRALNRLGMGTGASPLLKASFEMTGKFLTEAAMYGHRDNMRGASARIVAGALVRGGTGAFSLRHKVTL